MTAGLLALLVAILILLTLRFIFNSLFEYTPINNNLYFTGIEDGGVMPDKDKEGQPVHDPSEFKKVKRAKRRIEKEETRDYTHHLNILASRIKQLEDQLKEREDLIRCIGLKEKRVRIWQSELTCPHCSNSHNLYIAFVNRKIFFSPDMQRLEQKLRFIGLLIKTNSSKEIAPDLDGKPFDGECTFLTGDILDLKVPDVLPPDVGDDAGTSRDEDVS